MNTNSIDLFAGAGGWDLAAQSFNISPMGYEWWGPACETRDAAGLRTFQTDIRDLAAKSCDLLIASPPCQTFSVSSGSKQDPDDERTQLVWEPLRWMVFDTPVIVMEQVPPAAGVFEEYATFLRRRAYTVDVQILNAADYGVPQTRKRVVLRAVKGTLRPVRKTAMVSWNDALGVSGILESNYRGGDRDPITNKWALGRKGEGVPGFTVTGKVQKIWGHDGSRRLMTPAEAGVLQGFPHDYPWQGTIADQWQQIGNAIPVQLAHAILESVL